MTEDTLLTMKEVARLLKVSADRVYRWRKMGVLDVPMYSVMGRPLFKRAHIIAFIEQREVNACQPR